MYANPQIVQHAYWHIAISVDPTADSTNCGGMWIGEKRYAPVYSEAALIRVDTLYDTIVHSELKTLYTVISRIDTALLVRCDTVHDRVAVILPIETRYYGDSTYLAWISGYRPSLDSIKIYAPVVREILKQPPAKAKRLSIGPSAGASLTPEGVRPSIGFTLQYKIFEL